MISKSNAVLAEATRHNAATSFGRLPPEINRKIIDRFAPDNEINRKTLVRLSCVSKGMRDAVREYKEWQDDKLIDSIKNGKIPALHLLDDEIVNHPNLQVRKVAVDKIVSVIKDTQEPVARIFLDWSSEKWSDSPEVCNAVQDRIKSRTNIV